MASSSGTDLPTKDEALDSIVVPPALHSIAPIFRAADEIEKDNPRVAYLYRSHGFDKACVMDPTSSGRQVRQFKTLLLHKLKKDEIVAKHQLASSDTQEILKYYHQFYEKNIKDGESYRKKPEEMTENCRIATVMYDVLLTVVPQSQIDKQTRKMAEYVLKMAEDVKKNRGQYVNYNILPLYTVGDKPAIIKLPEIKAALRALQNINSLPIPRFNVKPPNPDDKSTVPTEGNKPVNDILDWLSSIFGFQKGNVANQREHLLLLLANMDVRHRNLENYTEYLNSDTVQRLRKKVFENYDSWINYLHCESNIWFPSGCDRQQLELIYIALYLLIWGEASNIRFMPECLCYIFHQMAKEVYGILYGNAHWATGEAYRTTVWDEESFLKNVVTPIYRVLSKEAERSKNGKASHSRWRNYDDLNEYFWSDRCFRLGWPMDPLADFFRDSDGIQPTNKRPNQAAGGRGKPKTNFVEVRTFWHLYRSFDRMWIFLILAFQAMIIVAWSPSGSLTAFFDADVFRSVLSIFITNAFLNLLQATLDIILSWHCWKSLKFTQILRYLLKFAVAGVWAVVLPMGYSSSVQSPTGLLKFFSSWARDWQNQSFYNYAVALYLLPNILATVLFFLPCLRKHLECSNGRIATLLMWWAQPKLYIGRGLHEDVFSLLKYTLFWIMLLISKLSFSYYVEILPLVAPTKIIMEMPVSNYQWHEFFPNACAYYNFTFGTAVVTHNIGAVIAIWAPIVLVYFMDAQIWYAIFSTIFGGIRGAFSQLGEIRTLGMLRSRFESLPSAFGKHLMPSQNEDANENEERQRKNIANFSHVWNAFITSMREEDLISNRDRDLLLVPYSSGGVPVVQWPPSLIASKIAIALDMAKDFTGKADDDLFKKIESDDYMYSAVIECYQTLRDIIYGLLEDEADKKIVKWICDEVEEQRFLANFRMSGLPFLSKRLEKFLKLLLGEDKNVDNSLNQIIALQNVMEIITRDVMINGHKILERAHNIDPQNVKEQRFQKLKIDHIHNPSWRKKVARLHLLLTFNESAINVPQNLDARRRITFFANSLFMKMPPAPKVRDMLSFSVLTPYYKEDVLYPDEDLIEENEDGISILFYLQKIYPDEWTNFQERLKDPQNKIPVKDRPELTRQWVSYRAQTLSRTVRGMMYYRDALHLQCVLERAGDSGYQTSALSKNDEQAFLDCEARADLKFTYVVSCQVYGAQKSSNESSYTNILKLMLKYPSLRVAYIDTVEEEPEEPEEEPVTGEPKKTYFSVLLKGGDNGDEEIYRIKLPGSPIEIGEGKPENQNHAIIFTRGEALQTIDMNQDNYFEEAFKMRNVLEEFQKHRCGNRKPTILGLREHIFTGSVSSLAWFMSNQETSFVTIGQRVLANPLRVRFHYGHPDIFDRIFHITRGGISKASKKINLSEDIFAGYNSTMRRGFITHHEYIQVGKGRDVGMNQISDFEAKVSSGNGEQTLSRDVYRLGHRFDFYRMLSFYFTTVGFYFSSMVTVLTVYVFLYGRMYMVMSGLENEILDNPAIHENKAFEEALVAQSVFQLGFLFVLPMVVEVGLEKGFRTALGYFIIMQLQLAPFFFTFQLGTKAHYYGRAILHGGSKYRATGRGFAVVHAKFSENYRVYSRSHFVKGLELLILLIVYRIYRGSYRSSNLYLFTTFSMWFLVASWLFAPFIFNPSGFDWQKTVDDWKDWNRWMGNPGSIGISRDKSWESWWDEEQEHLKSTDTKGRILEIILATRFLIYQYGIVYHLDIANHSKSSLVYGLSWIAIVTLLLVSKMFSLGRERVYSDMQLMIRILKLLLFLGFMSVMTILFVVFGLTISDIFAAMLAFLPTGWAFLLIGQACRPMFKEFRSFKIGQACWPKFKKLALWDSIKELGRAYDYIMGLVIFMPIAILSWFPFVSEFQTRILFNQAFSRGLQISRILAGRKDKMKSRTETEKMHLH